MQNIVSKAAALVRITLVQENFSTGSGNWRVSGYNFRSKSRKTTMITY